MGCFAARKAASPLNTPGQFKVAHILNILTRRATSLAQVDVYCV